MVEKRLVDKEEALEYAKKKGLHYSEVSAKTDEGISELFRDALEDCIDFIKEKKDDSRKKTVTIEQNKKNTSQNNKKCCGN